MKYIVIAIALLSCSPLYAQGPQPKGAVTADSCLTPAILRITKVANDIYYQVDQSKPHKFYKLGEASIALRRCSPDNTLFVVADPDVPISAMILPSKEQLTKVRYFMLFSTGGAWEISWNQIFPKLPISPDIHAEPEDDGALHPPTKITVTKVPK
ncbi:MAG: hypothetical protein ABI147_09030 [Acidobacteriaceae bacterium]